MLSVLLNSLLIAAILLAQFRELAEMRRVDYVGMLSFLFVTMVAGGLVGGFTSENRKGFAITTSVRNVGVSLVIVTGSFPGTAILTSVTAYALFQTIIVLLIALAWGRLTPTEMVSVKMKAA
jgi:bile acid:Na+ symporter, BASS family